ncbi:MAG: hypothetical protein JXR87_06280, partial [Candidatus Marinimicrobia bacterium]|nr:hypothetical protein [Candidatus Neomarinimicrobiota bacterium]
MLKKLGLYIFLNVISIVTLAESIELLSINKNTALLRTGSVYHRLSVQQSDSDTVVVDTLFYFQPPSSNADYSDYLGNYQGAGDTCINWFTLLAPGKITKLMMQNSSTGYANWLLWAPAIENDNYLFPGEPGSTQLIPSTAKPHYCPKLNMSQQLMDSLLWNTYDLTLANGVSPIVLSAMQLDFWVGYRLDASGDPKIWQDGSYHYSWTDGSCRSFTTLHSESVGKWYRNIQPGTDNWVAHMMQVEVVYETIPPIISDLPDLCDTFSESRTIWTEVVELEGDPFDVFLTMNIGVDGVPDTLTMDYDSDNFFWADIYYNPGDTLYYYVWAQDSTGMIQSSNRKSFVCVLPPQETNILFIDNSTLKTGNKYLEALNRRGFDYFYWNISDHNGIDTTVIYYPDFLTLIVLDGDEMILPVTSVDEQDIYRIAGFLNSGGNLLLVDMDYLYRWEYLGSGRFELGEFAYDYLGIEDYIADPDEDYTVEGGDADTLMLSVAGNPLTSDFSADSVAYGPIRYQIGDSVIENWSDFIEPSKTADGILKGQYSNQGMAVCLESEYFRTASFFVPIELAQDTADFYSLLDSTLTWLNENTTRLDTTFS